MKSGQPHPGLTKTVSRRTVLQSGAAAAGGLLLGGGSAFASDFLFPPDAARSNSPRMQCEFLAEPLGLQTPSPRLSWTPPASLGEQVAYQVEVSSAPHGRADLWDSGRTESTGHSVLYAGKPLKAYQQAFWRVRTWNVELATSQTFAGVTSEWSPTARWAMGPLHDADWADSQWIGRDDLLENTQEKMPGTPGLPKEPNFFPAPHLRTRFTVHKPLRSALLYACAPGFAELSLNGQKLGTAERDPGFTDFDRRLLYVAHDVTALLQSGDNAMGAILGTGWYDVHDVATWHMNTAPWRQRPRLRLLLALSFADGSQNLVTSGPSWRSAPGPILRDGVYTGEVYDARLEMPGWNTPGFDDSAWSPVLPVEAPHGKLTPLPCEPVRITRTITPLAITEPKPGVFIVNMGQNFSGHTQLRVMGSTGHAITMRYAELLNADGMLNSAPIDHFMMATEPRQPFQQDTYICKGTGEIETWEQRFSWSGFQYVEVTNFPGKPSLENFRGRFAHTDMGPAGDFRCSDEVANLVQRATCQSFLSNAQSYPTDCPQREKNGWTGDAGLAVEAGIMNFQSTAFYSKWLDDFADSQRPDGGVPVLVPNGGWGNGERWPGDVCPPWDAAYIVICWELYRATGDRRLLERHAEPLQRYVDFFLSHRKANGLAPALGIGDWSPWKATTPQDYITNAYLYLDLTLLAKIFSALNRKPEAARYASIASEVGTLTHEEFYSATTHRYANGSQMAQGTALHFGFVPAAERDATFKDLVSQIETLGHLDVGFLGAKYVTRALAEGGRTDLAYKVCCQRMEMPSYAYWVKTMGSTTLWEGWKAGPSYNHIMFGDISAWFYNWVAGIQQEAGSVGFDRIVFCPTPVGNLTEASASYLSPRGTVASRWKILGKEMTLELTVPQGARARLIAPQGARVLSSGASRDVGDLRSGTHSIRLTLG